jgi:hypothetical protein
MREVPLTSAHSPRRGFFLPAILRTLLPIAALLAGMSAHASDSAAISIVLADGRAVEASPALLAPLGRHTVSATAHGRTASYEGHDLRTVLAAAGVAQVESLRGGLKELRRSLCRNEQIVARCIFLPTTQQTAEPVGIQA